MPWSYPDNVPDCAKNWTAEEQEKCVKAANARLKETGDDTKAIQACIHAAGRTEHPGGEKKASEEGNDMKDDSLIDEIQVEDVEGAPEDDQELEEGEQETKQAAQRARAKKYGITAREGRLSKPKEWANVDESQFADPVNYAYPCHTKENTQSALRYWGKPKNRSEYDSKSQGVITKRLRRFAKKWEIETELDESDHENLRSMLLLQLEDGQLPGVIPIHVLGKWTEHPSYPPFEMTESMMDEAIANFDNRVLRPQAARDAQVVVDDQHSGGEANGWITRMYKRPPYLMGEVAWTERGRKLVGDKRYRFISPLYTEHYTRDGTDHGVVIKEVTLTNRNFLKELPAIGQVVLQSEDAARSWVLVPDSIKGKEVTEMPNDEKDTKLHDVQTPPAENPKPEPKTVQLTEDEYKKLQDEVKKAEANERRLLALESEAKTREIDAVVKSAGQRGVDAYTLNTMKSLLLQLPRDGAQDIELELEEGKGKVKANLYTALIHFLDKVPATVPTGEETRSLNEPPGAETKELSKEEKEMAAKLVKDVAGELPAEE